MIQINRLNFTHYACALSFGCMILVATISQTGCHRGYYRRQADAEVQRLVQEKLNDPRWSQASNGTIDIDPQSRMFDPFSSDHPPIPPDDATSHSFMQNVDCRDGYPHWHSNGDTNFVENPEWRSYLPVNENGQVVMDLEAAYKLALVHSTDLQQQRETLYRSALSVSLERFGFETQLFSGYNSFLTANGRLRNGGASSTTLSNSLGANGQGAQLRKLGITGATFAAGLANSILWNFAGPNTNSVSSLIDFSVIQPLLRGAGRDVIMESLTQAERTLLANVRQMDRFRRGFYLEIITGRNAGAGPNASGSFLGSPGSASSSVGGYLGLLQQQQQIRIQEFNVRQLESVLEQFREFLERERIDKLQVRQFEGNVYSAQQGLLQAKINYQNSLDNFKRTLGLPPNLDVLIRDDYMNRFEFISDEITERQNKVSRLRTTTGDVLNEIATAILPKQREDAESQDQPETNFKWSPEIEQELSRLAPFLEQARAYLQEFVTIDASQINADFDRLAEVRPRRLAYLQELRNSMGKGDFNVAIEPQLLSADHIPRASELRALYSKIENGPIGTTQTRIELQQLQGRLANIDRNLQGHALYDYITDTIIKTTSALLSNIYNAGLEMSLLQAQARGNSIELARVNIESENAVNIARCFRRDWMNARASLVDEWRQIEIIANQLEAELDLVFEGQMGNTGDNPLKFRGANGQLRAGFRFDSPIVRLSERNQYRQALISYQQTRRSFYQFEDEIERNLRQTIRSINLNKILFELNRQNIQVAIDGVELARLRLEDPSTTALGATTAINLTTNINSLQRNQTSFLSVWTSYEVLRRSLDFDLGTFQIDPNGNWIDPEVIDSSIANRAAGMMGVELDGQFCCNVDTSAQNDIYDRAIQSYQEEIAPGALEPQPTPADQGTAPDQSRINRLHYAPVPVTQRARSITPTVRPVKSINRTPNRDSRQFDISPTAIDDQPSHIQQPQVPETEWEFNPLSSNTIPVNHNVLAHKQAAAIPVLRTTNPNAVIQPKDDSNFAHIRKIEYLEPPRKSNLSNLAPLRLPAPAPDQSLITNSKMDLESWRSNPTSLGMFMRRFQNTRTDTSSDR